MYAVPFDDCASTAAVRSLSIAKWNPLGAVPLKLESVAVSFLLASLVSIVITFAALMYGASLSSGSTYSLPTLTYILNAFSLSVWETVSTVSPSPRATTVALAPFAVTPATESSSTFHFIS